MFYIERMLMKKYFIYILSNKDNRILYVGITSNLARRIYEHKNKIIYGFSSKYNLSKLVYYEEYNDIHEAIKREKQIKKWKREFKNNKINELNPLWKDLLNYIHN